jgi:hypothetical protein
LLPHLPRSSASPEASRRLWSAGLAYVSRCQHTSAHVSKRQHMSAYAAYVSIRQHTRYACICLAPPNLLRRRRLQAGSMHLIGLDRFDQIQKMRLHRFNIASNLSIHLSIHPPIHLSLYNMGNRIHGR